MIPARIASMFPPLLGVLAITFAATCASKIEAPIEWLELDGDVGGGGFGGAATAIGGSSPSSSSAGGAPGTGGGGESGGGGAGGGEAGGAPCGDTGPGEPNEIEATATFLGNATDCDGTGDSVSGVLTSASDVDWYRYVATDEFGCTVDPSRAFTPAGGARLCKFAQCTAGGAATVTCDLGASPETSPSGRPGCCHDRGFSMDIDCSGADDDATIFLRVDRPAGGCALYSILFHY
jgi:hypothetical protein